MNTFESKIGLGYLVKYKSLRTKKTEIDFVTEVRFDLTNGVSFWLKEFDDIVFEKDIIAFSKPDWIFNPLQPDSKASPITPL